jgi:succinate dehydrogenase hydrophobic anchor subunit
MYTFFQLTTIVSQLLLLILSLLFALMGKALLNEYIERTRIQGVIVLILSFIGLVCAIYNIYFLSMYN